jgi:hypothetical protein
MTNTEVSIHTIFEPPACASNSGVVLVSVWVCFGPFDEDTWHAEEHPDSICLASSVPLAVGDRLSEGLGAVLKKYGAKPTFQRYPGD